MRTTRQQPWWWAANEVVDHHLAEIGPTAFAVYCVLCRHAHEGECYLSMQIIAEKAGLRGAAAFEAIRTLEAAGLIRRREVQPGDDLPTLNLYAITEQGGIG